MQYQTLASAYLGKRWSKRCRTETNQKARDQYETTQWIQILNIQQQHGRLDATEAEALFTSRVILDN